LEHHIEEEEEELFEGGFVKLLKQGSLATLGEANGRQAKKLKAAQK